MPNGPWCEYPYAVCGTLGATQATIRELPGNPRHRVGMGIGSHNGSAHRRVNNSDRARRMVQHRLGDRAQAHAFQATEAAGAHDEHLGPTIIAVSDSQGATWNPGGLDVAAVRAHKKSAGSVAGFPGGTAVPRDDIIGFGCELLIPAAQPDVVTTDNAGKISARVILEGANIPITVQAEGQLAERGVLCIPDVVANSGGVICAAAEYRGAGHAEAFTEIGEKISDSTAELLDRLRPGTLTPRAAADQMAHDRLRQALALRRRF